MNIRDNILKWANSEHARGNPVSIQEIAVHVQILFDRQARAAEQGMDAAKNVAAEHLKVAKRLHAECNPEALESEREANARLTEENDRLHETARLAERFARAKGRHNSQHAMCDLLEHFGLPCVRPGGNE